MTDVIDLASRRRPPGGSTWWFDLQLRRGPEADDVEAIIVDFNHDTDGGCSVDSRLRCYAGALRAAAERLEHQASLLGGGGSGV